MSIASFSVSAEQFVLLSEYTPNHSPLVKEYSVNVTSSKLDLTFTPSRNSLAFLNALEVISLPESLILDNAILVHPVESYRGLLSQAMETVARVNMGGQYISYNNDRLWRTWVTDDGYLLNNDLARNVSYTGAVKYAKGITNIYSAPLNVYGTAKEMNLMNYPSANFNVTWVFDVEIGFQYLVRFHLCDIVSKPLNVLIFNIYLDSWMVCLDCNISDWTGSLATAVFMDAITPVVARNKLKVIIGPSTEDNVYPNAILNGIEIMKLNNSLSSCSGNVFIPSPWKKSWTGSAGLIVGVTIGGGVSVVLCASLLFFFSKRTSKLKNSNATGSVDYNLDYRIPFAVVQEGTNNFDEGRVIGIGGFGKVYKGVLGNGTEVAVKRGNPRSQQGLAEFRTEIEMLSQFRHRQLVSLIGYCDERNEMILIYEYMENGTLKSHLYGSGLPSLSWKQRLEICIGAARGLHYLHSGCVKAVIHHDVKSVNILLDENFSAKIADFGISKTIPDIDQTHVSTAIKGSFGYLDPEYFRRQQLTQKSDVYSFGVVLCEVLCARPVIDPTLPREMVNLAEWAMKWHKKGKLDEVIDPNLAGKIKPESLRKFGETIENCLADFGVDRPTMGDVLWNLENTLQLQDAVVPDNDDLDPLSPRVHNLSKMKMV